MNENSHIGDTNKDGFSANELSEWGELPDSELDYESDIPAFAAHVLQKRNKRLRRDWRENHGEPKREYRNERKNSEQELGHIGTSLLDVRDKITSAQAVKQELNDWGVDDINSEMPTTDEEGIIATYAPLFNFLGENQAYNPDIINEYEKISDKKRQLEFILRTSLADRVLLFCSDAFVGRRRDVFVDSLQRHLELIEGARNHQSNHYDREDIMRGIDRISLLAAMIGTPEYGAIAMAKDIRRSGSNKDISPDFPEVSGTSSGVYCERDASSRVTYASIGSWGPIIDEYGAIAKDVAKNNPGDIQETEYKAVRQAAKIFAESMDYNPPYKSSSSSYVSSFRESVAWAKLDWPVKAQLRGMRQKISGINLSGIGRFIGKSGCSKERKSLVFEVGKLKSELSNFTNNESSDEDKQNSLRLKNEFEIEKQNRWRDSELARIQKKYNKKIDRTRSEDRRATYEQRRDEEMDAVRRDVEEQIRYFENRNFDEFLSDTKDRIALLSRRIEKRKSLAEKAIDLHFISGNSSADPDSHSKYHGCIDWINEAPFGVIKRAHRRATEGMSPDLVNKEAICETLQQFVSDPEHIQDAMQRIFENYERMAHTESAEEKGNLRQIIRLARVLDREGRKNNYQLDTEHLIKIYNCEAFRKYHGSDAWESDSNYAQLVQKLTLEEIITSLDSDIDINAFYFAKSELGKRFEALGNMDDIRPEVILKYASDISTAVRMSKYLISPDEADRFIGRFGLKCLQDINSKGFNICHLSRIVFLEGEEPDIERVDPVVLAEEPWLIMEYGSCANGKDVGRIFDYIDTFPFNKSENEKNTWFAKNAFVHLGDDWGLQKIGKLIHTRLLSGTDWSLHDATYWLEDFRIPNVAYDINAIKNAATSGYVDSEQYAIKLKDPSDEKLFLRAILDASPEQRARLNLSRKKQNMIALFSSSETISIYDLLVRKYKDPSFDVDTLIKMTKDNLDDLYNSYFETASDKTLAQPTDFESFKQSVETTLNEIRNTSASERIGEIAQRLKQYGRNRKKYVDDTISWLTRHMTTPRTTLTKVWGDRAFALSFGIKDNASSIESWQKTEALFSYAKTHPKYMQEQNLTIEELYTTYEGFMRELSRCYDSEKTISMIGFFKEKQNPDKIMPPKTIELMKDNRKFIGTVLAYDDPRGATQGVDTGCCMTVGGVSDSCIKSGYRDSNAGFFDLYDPKGRLMAQSYFYTNLKHPDVLVIDNIEANSGRDSNRIIDLYRDYFTQYIKDRFSNDPTWRIRQVNIGTGYGDVAKPLVLKLDATEIVHNRPGIYTDADKDQRLLLRFTDEEIAKIRSQNGISLKEVEFLTPQHIPSESFSPLSFNRRAILQELERRIYPDAMRQYDDEDFIFEELSESGVEEYSFFINSTTDATNEPVGYCLAYERNSETDPMYESKVVYIADFGIVPEARNGAAARKGFNELLDRISANDVKRIEMDARERTTYSFFTSDVGRRYLEQKGYRIVEQDTVEYSFGDNEYTLSLSLEKI